MSYNAAGAVAILTGAAQGIGRATLERLLAAGWRVAAVDRRAVDLEALPASLQDNVLPIEYDITTPEASAKIVRRTLDRFGGVDLLINNAGIGNAGPVHETTDADLERFIAVNFVSAFRLSREVVPLLKAGGAIIHVASVLAAIGSPATSAYSATKAALVGLTRQMAVEYGPRGIRVNAVAPGLIETELTATRLRSDERFRRIWKEGTPWPRLGRPEDVAAAIAFLASSDAEFVNGHVLTVDGGWSVSALSGR